MNSSARKELYNNNRRQRQSKARQALLITEYIYTKYFQIYREAAEYYNRLNALCPTKRDLRRCGEFQRWKKQTSGQTVQPKSSARPVHHTGRNYHVVVHPDIPLEQQSESAESSDLSAAESPDLDIDLPEQQQHLQRTVPDSPERTQQRLQRTEPPANPPESSDLSAAESPDLDIDLPEQQQHLQRTVPDSPERTQQRLQRTEPPANPPGEKIMELKIPLLKPSVVTETLQIVTQETLGNSLHVAAEETIQDFTTLYPTLEEGLPQHIVDHIINELRVDPDLQGIMDDIEQDIEFNQLGMDLDIPEVDPLEEELENLQW